MGSNNISKSRQFHFTTHLPWLHKIIVLTFMELSHCKKSFLVAYDWFELPLAMKRQYYGKLICIKGESSQFIAWMRYTLTMTNLFFSIMQWCCYSCCSASWRLTSTISIDNMRCGCRLQFCSIPFQIKFRFRPLDKR